MEHSKGTEHQWVPGPPPAEEAKGIVTVSGTPVAAELKADPEEIAPQQAVTLRVINHGEVALNFGRPITVERWDGTAWVETEASRNTAWTMDLLYVQPEAKGPEQQWPFYQGPQPGPGWYRFTKDVQAEGTDGVPERLTLRARVHVRE
ncbi:MAG: DUF6087 family protein [Verrucomicrobiia bacterium]